MKIHIYSKKQKQTADRGWFTGGTNISYEKSYFKRPNGKSYYTLSFKYKFLYSNDVVSFAYSQPFSFTKLNNYL